MSADTTRLPEYTGATGLRARVERSRRRPARAVAERQPARVEVQGARRRRARRSEDGGLQLRRHPLHAQHVSSGVNASGGNRDRNAGDRRVRRRRRPRRRTRWRRRRRRRRRRGGGDGRPRRGRLRRARDPQRRVGLRQQPDRHRGRDPPHHRASPPTSPRRAPIAKKTDVKLAPVPAYQDYWATPMQKDPDVDFAAKTSRRSCRRSSTPSSRTRTSPASTPRSASPTSGSTSPRAKAPTSSRRPAQIDADVQRHRAQGRRRHATRNFIARAEDRRLGSRRRQRDARERRAHRRRSGRVDAPPSRSAWASRISILTPSHAMLTIHEIVAHATELDRIIGYEANYAGTSFVKLSRRRQAEIRLEAVQRHRRSHDARRPRHHRLRRRRREDDGVPDHPRRHPRRPADQPRDGALSSARRQAAAARRPLVARLSVPAHAERPRRAGPGRIADAGARSSPTRRTAC